MTVLVGTYNIAATHPEYTTVVVPGVEVTIGVTTTVDMAMDPKGTLFGYVTDFDNGFPLSGATVTADDGTFATTDISGYYEMLLDAGSHVVTATLQDYAPENAIVNIVSMEYAADFALLAAICDPDPSI
jgi:hypothetical protein